MRVRRDRDFVSLFDEKTGTYLRTGVIEDGTDTGADPFMASFPELIDVGIMGHCIHGRSGLCQKAGIECYQSGLLRAEPNMSIEDFSWVCEQCRGKSYQFALGGRGDPDQHEHFAEILRLCREAHIVPNFTTSGLGMNEEISGLCAQYCGAVAVSWYRADYTHRAISMLQEAGVKTNIHYVLSRDSLDEATERLRDHSFPEGVNAIVFLLHKPVGQGSLSQVINLSDPRLNEFMGLTVRDDHPYKIGFDSCSVPALLRYEESFDLSSVDTCEGARWSAYITPDLKMLPCSFDNQSLQWAVDLRQMGIQEAWESPAFEDFRNHFRNACPACQRRQHCMGGCPICPEIVLCDDPARTR